MIKAILFALLFIIVGMVLSALIAPLVFHGVDFRQLGAALFPFIFVLCGIVGFVFGWRRRKKHFPGRRS